MSDDKEEMVGLFDETFLSFPQHRAYGIMCTLYNVSAWRTVNCVAYVALLWPEINTITLLLGWRLTVWDCDKALLYCGRRQKEEGEKARGGQKGQINVTKNPLRASVMTFWLDDSSHLLLLMEKKSPFISKKIIVFACGPLFSNI